ncbi:metal-dependent hydrolase [Salinigranum rubrum]
MIGYTIVSVMREPAPIVGVVGAIFPDIDLLFAPAWSFPLVHRGITHTPLCGAVVVVSIWSWRRSRPHPSSLSLFSTAVTLGYGSHLIVDSFTASGVPWLYR